jgi:hypothetical protein
MTTIDVTTELFCRVDEAMAQIPKPAQAVLWPSEVVTLPAFSRTRPAFAASSGPY